MEIWLAVTTLGLQMHHPVVISVIPKCIIKVMDLAVRSTILPPVCGSAAIIMRMANWKPLQLSSLDDRVSKKQYEIWEGMAEINATAKDLNTVEQWSVSHVCLIRQSDSFGI